MAGADVAATVAAYEQDAAAYARASPPMTAAVRARVAEIAERLGPGARVLEIGTGQGRDALALEEHGLRVHRTDITPAFVARLREAGHPAAVLDPLTDDLAPPPDLGVPRWDGVWAQACLLHVDRDALGTVLRRLAAVVRPGGALFVSLKEGDGETWSTHGAVTAARRFVLWREPDLVAVLGQNGWVPGGVERTPGSRAETWLTTMATRGPEDR